MTNYSAKNAVNLPKTTKSNVLVFPAGTEIGLELFAALKYERTVKLFGASSTLDHGVVVFENYTCDLPYVNADDFVTRLNDYIANHTIDYIFPAHDDVLQFLTINRHEISAEIMAPNGKTAEICRFKSYTYDALTGASYLPDVYTDKNNIPHFPVFVKPDAGEGSRGAKVIHDQQALEGACLEDPSIIICEYLPGPEYTIDCYTNNDGVLLFTGMRQRLRVRNGISVSSRPVPASPDVLAVAGDISKRLKMWGGWFFQLKEDSAGRLKLLEAAPRIAGTMAVHRVAGINFPSLMLYEKQGSSVDVFLTDKDVKIDRALVNRYTPPKPYDHVYLDLDDTLIEGSASNFKVNTSAAAFLFQCRNKNIPVSLITRHATNPHDTLNALGLSPSLFHDIIWIENGDSKCRFMTKGDNPIFIDDSFRERRDVYKTMGWRVYSPDAFERLTDWRR